MGKGIIKSGGDDGLYGIELTLHRDRVDATIEIINAQIEALTTKIDGMEEGDEKDLEKLRRASYQKRKDYINDNMPEDPTVSAWCGDLTEDLSGNVGTIEIPGERGIVQIQPGYDDNAVYNTERDGQLQPAIASTPAGTFYNLAMLPGWQKWMPTYRHGTISNIDTDANTCDVALNAVESSQQSLNVNQADTLTGISIEYMSCNASAFEDGDEVLVKFEGQDWSGAKVVGFKDNPKACGFQFKLTRGDGTLITEISGLLNYIKVYNSSDILLSTTEIYDAETEHWNVQLSNPGDADSNGYWVDYICDDGIITQYPYRYKSADKDQESDLISIGKYEDEIPYWEISTEYLPVPDPEDEPMANRYALACAAATTFATLKGTFNSRRFLWAHGLSSWQQKRIIKSSVPWYYKHTVYHTTLACWYEQHGSNICANPLVCVEDSGGINHDTVITVITDDSEIDVTITNLDVGPHEGVKSGAQSPSVTGVEKTYTITDLTEEMVNLECRDGDWVWQPYTSTVLSVDCGIGGVLSGEDRVFETEFYYE